MATPPWILAIDFGTSFTVAVAQVEGRSPEVLEIAGERRVPSVVLTDEGDRIVVGRVAEELSASNPRSTLRAPKSRLGDQAPVVLDGKPYQVVQLVAALLAFVYDEAVRQMGAPPSEVRLTHPATWNRPLLNRLLEAATKAGVPRPVLVPEPVAAALSFASEVGVAEGDHVVVYDLGGGTFDTAVVTATATGFVVVGRPGGDPTIGGELFDEILVNEIGSRLEPGSWESMQVASEPSWQRVAASLRNESRRAKETLSSHSYADLLLPMPAGMSQQRVTRDEYEALIGPYIDETVTLLGRCIANAGLTPDRLAAIYLVGGASRAPIVERLTMEAFPGVLVSRRGDPKTAVAMGAVRAALAPDAGVARFGQPSTEDASAPTAEANLILGVPPSGPGSRPEATAAAIASLVPPPTAPPAAGPPPPAAAPVRAAPPSVPPPPGAPTPPPRQFVPTAPPPARRSGRKGVVIGVVAAIVALALVVGAMIALTSGGGGDDTTPSGTDARATTTARVSTTVEDTVPTVPAAELEAKLLTLDEVNSAAGGGFVDVEPGPLGDPICGLKALVTQTSAIKIFDNVTTGARVASAIDRYATETAAREAYDQEATLRTTCADRNYTIDGVSYTVVVIPFDDVIPTGGREYLGLLIGYSPVLDSSTTVPGALAPQPIYQFVVETVDGPNLIGSSYITVGRQLTDDEIAAYITLFQLAVNRAVS